MNKFRLSGILLLLLLSCTGIRAVAQTTLSAGDLAIVGYNSGGTNDDFSFILLVAISAGTQINFTDLGWSTTGFQGTSTTCGANMGAAGDGALTWTAGTALACGTQVRIQCQSNLSASTGSVTPLLATYNSATEYMSLSTGGDEIFAFQGTLAAPVLITGINMNGGWDASLGPCEFNSSKSTLPAALNSSNSLAVTPEVDNAVYNGSIISQSPAALRAAIFNNANWSGGTNFAATFTLPIPFTFDCSPCVAPAVTAQPANRTICVNGSTTFPVTATGNGITYQWQVNTGSGFNNVPNTAPYSNVTTATLTVSNAAATLNGNLYRCVVSGSCGTATSNSGTLTISNPATSGSQTDVLCHGSNTGSATVVPSGGIAPYTYSWSPSGGSGATASSLAANTYTVTVTDNLGCQTARSYTLSQPAAFGVTPSQTNLLCNGGTTGIATVTVTGATAPYTYSWSPGGGTAATATGLSATTYTCTIKDANLCQTTQSVTLTQPPAFAITPSQTNLLCSGGTNGTATVTVTGATAPYTYSWSPGGGTAATATGLSATTYTCTIKDANLCQTTQSVTLTQPPAFIVTPSQTNLTCNGIATGTATVTVSGATAPYTYSWSPGGGTAATATGLSATTYTCTIKDAHLCQTTQSVALTQPTAIQVITSPDITICAGTATGLLSGASGGNSGFTYQWQPGNLSGSLQTVMPAATTQYIVTATDGSGCTAKDTVVVTVAPNLAQSAIDGSSTPGNVSSSSSQTSGGLQSYYNGNCNLIASVQQNAALGNITASVTVLGSVQIFAGRPYVARWYEIVPQNNVAGVVTLYFKQSDFNQYNAYASLNNFPLLPQNPTDQAGIDTLAVTKISGGTLGTGTASLIVPSSVIWDAAMQYWRVTFNTPSFSQFFIHAKNAAGTPLPVAYTAFDAVKDKGRALLTWTTATERNNTGFTIERSLDGKQFAAVGSTATMAKNGNSTAPLSYRFMDPVPAAGMNYYRLLQKDIDGSISYSLIRSLDFGNTASFSCYPNPADELLTIEHQSAEEDQVQFRMVDVTSRLVRQQEMIIHKGFNKNTMQLSGLPQGIYNLIIMNKNGILFRSKIVKK